MKKWFYAILTVFMVISSRGDAFFDIISDIVRYKKINNHFISALSNEDNEWKEGGLVCGCAEEKCFVFIPEGEDREYPNVRFIYSEYDLIKSKEDLSDINDVDSVYKKWFSEKNRSPWCTETILFQNAAEIRVESFSPLENPMFDRSTHKLVKIVQVGNKKFIAYQYKAKKKHLSEKEKKFWLAKIDWARVDFKKLGF